MSFKDLFRFLQHPRLDVDSAESRNPELIRWFYRKLKPLLWRYFRPVVKGMERIPDGAALFIGNHNGAMLMPDVLVFGAALYERLGVDGLPYGMAHQLGVRLPGINDIVVPLGLMRGTQETGCKLLAEGHRVGICPGGELDSMRAYRDRNKVIFGNRRGYIRMALRAGVPIIPFVASGAHETLYILYDGRWLARLTGMDRWAGIKAWPIVFCLPWGLWFGVPLPHFPFRTQIYVEVLEPVYFERSGEEAARDRDYVESCHQRVHSAMEAALRALDRERREAARKDKEGVRQ